MREAMIRFPASFAALALLLALPACGDSPRAQRNAPGSVWVVQSPTTRIYLCGTIHILRKQDYPLPAAYEHAYADSHRLVFELPPGSASDPKSGAMIESMGTYSNGSLLQDHVPEATWNALAAWAKKRKQPLASLNTLRPWLASLKVSMLEYANLGADQALGVEPGFEARARKDNKPGEGLETLAEQIGLFTTLTENEQVDLLQQTMADVSTLPDIFEKMIGAWRMGDADALHEMLFKEADKYPALIDRFLTRRNLAWMTQLEQFLAGKEHVMVLVGTGHLGGPQGVIELLRAKGFSVRMVAGEPAPSVR